VENACIGKGKGGILVMNVCPHCGQKLAADAKLCPDCGKGFDGRQGFLNLPREFWLILGATVGIVVFSLLDWIVISGSRYNLFGLWSQSGDAEWLVASFREVTPVRTYIIAFTILLVLSFALLLASLVRCKAKERNLLAYCGFGLSVFVSAAFYVVVIANYATIPRLELTVFPLLVFVVAALVSSMVFKSPKSAVDVIRLITRVFLYISYAALLALLIMTVFDVVRRMIFGIAMTGLTEYSMIFLIVCMSAMSYALVEGRFVNVGALVDMFPKWLNLTFEIFCGIVGFVFFALVGWQLIGLIDSSMRVFREAYFVIAVPRWPMYGILGLSFVSNALATIVYIYERVKNFKDPKERSVLDDPEIAFMKAHDETDEKEKLGGAE
jgi:TRAP-type C4-dicarboxylate transport system permease small subunit